MESLKPFSTEGINSRGMLPPLMLLPTSTLKFQRKRTKKKPVLNSSTASKVVTFHVNLFLQLKKASKIP